MHKYTWLFSLFCAVLWAGAAQGAGVTSALQKQYDALESMESSFEQTLLHKESGAKEKRSGILLFKKPLLVRWESKGKSPELLIVTKQEIWNVFEDEDIAYKYPLSMVQDSRSIIQVITGQARLEQDFIVEEKGKENGLVKLQLYPKEPVQALVEAIFWVDPATGLIRKLRMYDFYGNENEIAFTGQKPDAPIKDSVFIFAPPKGMQVEDRSNEKDAPRKPLLQ